MTIVLREVIKAIRRGKRSDSGFKAGDWNEITMVVLRWFAPGDPLTGDKCRGKLEGELAEKWNIWMRIKAQWG